MFLFFFFVFGILIFIFALFFWYDKVYFVKLFILWFSILIFFIIILLWILYDSLSSKYQYIFWFPLLKITGIFAFGLDGISIFFLLLTAFIIPSCILANWSLKFSEGFGSFTLYLLLIEFFLILAFSALDLLWRV